MANMPSAEVDIDIPLAARLVASQFPDLAEHPLHALTGGWDNAVIRLGSSLAVRLPRRAAAVPLAEHEHRWLPGIEPRISTSIPAPVRVGQPSELFGWPWSVVPWIDGTSAVDLPVADRGALAGELAEFISEMHVQAPHDAPRNPVRGVPLMDRDEAVRGRIQAGVVPRGEEMLALWLELRDTPPWSADPVWLHGDLHPGNLLVRDGRLSGVVDFGDLTAGDPATDLALAWLAFDAPGRVSFLAGLPERYQTDALLLCRARGWALSLATAFTAHSDDNPVMAAIGVHAIGQVLDDG
ncbi:MAG TPA: aminoglycoside phosphotransferase family protein [Glaciibacter sp.]|nr:aminoglycoside phosphotransferase family protein [Glaciibacter sp.]